MDTIQTYEEDRSVQGRFNAWWFGFNLATARPIVGGGIGAYNRELFARYAPDPLDFHDAHSIYFEVLAEQGFVGLGLFLAIGLLVMLTGRNIIRQCRGRDNLKWAADLAAMLQVSFVGYSVGGTFLGLAYFDLPYHLMALMVLTQAIVKRKLDAGPEDIEDTKLKAKAQPGYVMADPQADFGKNQHYWNTEPQPEQSRWPPSGGNRDRGDG
jgi:probable O-glycosylation ligase (exosortase A-associated)